MDNYFENYMDDAVIREDENGNRFIKTKNNIKERPSKSKQSITAYGGSDDYGIMHNLKKSSKELYDTFGIEWRFGDQQGEDEKIKI